MKKRPKYVIPEKLVPRFLPNPTFLLNAALFCVFFFFCEFGSQCWLLVEQWATVYRGTVWYIVA